MLAQGKRILIAAVTASAVGLSCTACLSTSATRLQPAAPQKQAQLNYAQPLSTTERAAVNAPQHAISTVHQIPPTSVQPQQALQLNSSRYVTNDGGQLQTGSNIRPFGEVSGIDLTVAEFAQSTRNGAASPLSLDRRWKQEDVQKIDAQYTFVAPKADTGLGLDLAVRPHVTINSQGDVKTTRAGAEVRVGQNLDLRGQTAKNSNWYFFAGADGEAIVWDVQQSGRSLNNGQVTLQDKVTVGDVQAGIAFNSPAGQMSVSYIQRDFEYRNGAISRSGEEEFAAVTLTWRR